MVPSEALLSLVMIVTRVEGRHLLSMYNNSDSRVCQRRGLFFYQ